jgi:hypothetical protein
MKYYNDNVAKDALPLAIRRLIRNVGPDEALRHILTCETCGKLPDDCKCFPEKKEKEQ